MRIKEVKTIENVKEIENEITNTMIKLYRDYGHFSRLENTEVEKAHKKWLTLKSIRDKLENARETIEEEIEKYEYEKYKGV